MDTSILVTDMMKLNTLGFMMDVHIHGTVHEWEDEDGDMIRKIQKIYTKKEKGKLWLYWEWQPNDSENFKRGYRDCGYSGICLENENINKLYFIID